MKFEFDEKNDEIIFTHFLHFQRTLTLHSIIHFKKHRNCKQVTNRHECKLNMFTVYNHILYRRT